MTKQDLLKHKENRIKYLNKRIAETVYFLDRNPTNQMMLKRLDSLRDKLDEVNKFNI